MEQCKVCSICKLEKPYSCFSNRKSHSTGKRPECKECAKKIFSEFYEKNKEKQRERCLNYQKKHKDELKLKCKEWRLKNKDLSKELTKKWAEKNKQKMKDHYKKRCAELHKCYIANSLNIGVAELTEDLYQIKKHQILIKRSIKQLTKEIQNGTE